MSIDFNILAECDNTLVFIAGDAMGVICYLPIAINAIKRFLCSYCTFMYLYRCHDLYLSASSALDWLTGLVLHLLAPNQAHLGNEMITIYWYNFPYKVNEPSLLMGTSIGETWSPCVSMTATLICQLAAPAFK